MTDLVLDGALVLYGAVGGVCDGEGFEARAVLEALSKFGSDTLLVRLNSGGGLAAEGVAVYNALQLYPGKVIVQVEAMAASAASVIAMAGEEIRMLPGAMMMVHDPAAITFGNAEKHRKNADDLDLMGNTYAGIYAGRTGLPETEIRELMRAETWMTGPEAVELGFASEAPGETGGARIAAAAFDYGAYGKAPAHLLAFTPTRPVIGQPVLEAAVAASKKKGFSDMDEHDIAAPEAAVQPPDTGTPATAVTSPATPVEPPAMQAPVTDTRLDTQANALNEARLSATTAERSRVDGIFRAVRAAKLDSGFAQELIAAGVPLADAHARVIDRVADMNAASETVNALPSRVLSDGVDRFRSGVTAALSAKAGLEGGECNEFSSMTLSELARASLSIRGLKPVVSGKNELVKYAFQPVMAGGMHSTSDFGEILSDVASKSMMKGFTEAEETFREWTSKGSLPDFKPTRRVGLNAFATLNEVQAGAEYTYGTIGDHGEPIVLATYGKLFAITRQAIVNDDLSVFTRIPNFMGRAALRTIGDLVYAVLSANPEMADGTNLFHADHGNLAGSGGAPSMATINEGIVAMVRQKDRGKQTAGSNIQPKFIVAPWALRSAVLQVLNSEYDPSKSTRAANTVRRAVEPVFDVRLDTASATAWYLAADQNQQDTVEVAYLDGVETPVLEQQAGWSIDGAEFKVRIDASVKALAWEGLYKNAGA